MILPTVYDKTYCNKIKHHGSLSFGVPLIDSKNQMDYTTKLGSYYFKKSLFIRKLHEGRRHE
jgi:hypothetical protein